MAEILLATLNAQYAHCAFGLRYLLANLGDLKSRTAIVEFECTRRTVDIVETLLAYEPRLVALGVYIWNIEQTTRLVAELKALRPELLIVLGGPEVSYETDDLEIVRLADCVITGEADRTFPRVCAELLETGKVAKRIVQAPICGFEELELPYEHYTEHDIARRVVYVEASRGCPYECEFCLSSLEIPVRQAPLDRFLECLQALLDRGLNQFKFVDRTFNLNVKTSRAILEFFLERYRPGLFLHFEMIPDRFPEALRECVERFPPMSLQFEVGLQTFNNEVAALIHRRQNNDLAFANLRWLREQTSVHIHADLIAGLPGESFGSFAAGFDRLVELGPHEIQVGLLKRLRGTPIARHDVPWQMVYSPRAPYEVLQTRLIDFATMQRLRRFARYWDLVANSGNFVESAPLIWQGAGPFSGFMSFCDWLYAESGQTSGVSLVRLAEFVFRYLTERQQMPSSAAAHAVWRDYCRSGRSDRPAWLRPWVEAPAGADRSRSNLSKRLRRQARHAGR
jgi:radical SAM superfamily enzyme YgiQ (UPF0313 family)